MKLDEQLPWDDADTSSTGAFTSLAVDSPKSASSMLWPSTPEPLLASEKFFVHHSQCPPRIIDTQLDANQQETMVMQAWSYPEIQTNGFYAVNHVFIDTTCAMDAPQGATATAGIVSSNPNSQIGHMQLEEVIQPRNVDIFAVDEFSSLERETPRRLRDLQWPTPDTASFYVEDLPLGIPHSFDTIQPALDFEAYDSSAFDGQQPVLESRILSLAEMIFDENETKVACEGALSDSVPSVGSALHGTGSCKPCGFFHKQGCSAGSQCTFCHLCDSGEKKRRQLEKRQKLRNVGRIDRLAAAGGA